MVIEWGRYPLIDTDPTGGVARAPDHSGPEGIVPFGLTLLSPGWRRHAGVWHPDEECRARICQRPRALSLNVIGLPGKSRVNLESPQALTLWTEFGKPWRYELYILDCDLHDGAWGHSSRNGPMGFNPPNPPNPQQLGYDRDQFPELVQIVECAWCHSHTTVDLAMMSKELRPLGWKPGTKWLPTGATH